MINDMPNMPQGSGRQFTKKRLPKLVNILLIVPLALGFSKLSEQFFPEPGQAPSEPESQQFTTIPATQKISLTSHQEIARWHLFGTKTVSKQAPVKAKKTVAPQTKLNLKLSGIAAEDNKHDGLAIIQKPNKEEKHFKRGDSVFGLAKLDEIHPDRVTLLRNGQYETLLLYKLNTRSEKKPRTKTVTKYRKTSVRSVKPVVDHEKVSVKSAADHENDDEIPDSEFWEDLDYEPAIINGQVAGLQIFAEESSEKEFLARQGLKAGDVITSINGFVMNSGKGVSNAIDALAEDATLNIVFTRQGATKSISVTR